jgi:predicted TIM-barrel fold metal-dependent hydrolase
MIDTHAHAVPEARLVPASRPLHGAAARAANRLMPSRRVLEIESLARLSRALPDPAFALVEQFSQIALLPEVLAGGTIGGLLTSMARHGLSHTVLIGARGVSSNRWVLEQAWPRARHRLIPVTTLPDLSTRTATLDEWADAYRELAQAGAAGFKIHPNWDGVQPGHPSYDAAFTVAREYDRFIIVHTGAFHVRAYRQPEPLRLDALRPYLDRFPEVRVCLAHMNRDHPDEVWALQRKYDQLFTDTSWQPARVIRQAIDKGGSERLMLGSDWPLLHLGLQRDALRTAQRAASGRHLENIVQNAPQHFIGAGVIA